MREEVEACLGSRHNMSSCRFSEPAQPSKVDPVAIGRSRSQERTCHEQYGVDAQHPMVLQHPSGLLDEDLGLVGCSQARSKFLRFSFCPGFHKDLRFGDDGPYDSCKEADSSGTPEQTSPSFAVESWRGMRNKSKVDTSGK